MKNKIIIFGVTFLLIFVFLSGCDENNNNNNNNNINHSTEVESKFVGTWMKDNYSQLIFHENKTGSYSKFLMTWVIEGNVLTLNFITIVGNLSSEFFFSDNWNTLTLYDSEGEAVKYKRQ